MDIVIVGATASGKTAVAVEVAEQIKCPIISADARQCYIGMDIGTAKPTPQELLRATHFNVSILDPNVKDDAAAFVQRVNQWKQDHPARHWIVVGGSTLYLQSMLFPLDDIPKNDPQIQHQLEELIEKDGLQAVWQQLNECDPQYAKQMDGLNRQRIIRALCVFLQTGMPFSSYHQRDGFHQPHHALVFGLRYRREEQVKRIDARVDEMIHIGLVEEVRTLAQQGLSREDHAMKTVGYAEVFDYQEGVIDLQELRKRIQISTRQYSRRQMTWFKRWPFIEWIDMDELTTTDASRFIVDRVREVETQQKMA